MKIALCHKNTVADGSLGGFSTVYYALATEMAKRGHEVSLLTRHNLSALPHGVRLARVPQIAGISHSLQVADLVNRLQPDIIECPSWGAECLELARLSAHPTLVVRGDIPAIMYGEQRLAEEEQEMMKGAARNLAVSFAIAIAIRELYGIQVDDVIHNGVDTERFRPMKNRLKPGTAKQRRIVWVGRPTSMKGFDLLQILLHTAPRNFVFDLVVGPAQARAVLQSDFHTEADVHIHKSMPLAGLINLYNNADVVLSTSRVEGFGLAILEAMSCGTPAIVPEESGGPVEFVQHDVNGFLYSDLTELNHLIEQVTPVHGESARATAKRFEWAICAHKTLRTYECLLNS